MAHKAESVGVAKAALPALTTFVLAVLAGAFIALGAVFSTVVATGASSLPFGVGRLLVGVTFSLGLVLGMVGGAELFTGNNLIVMAWVGRKVTTGALLRNWAIVYLGNLVGAASTAALVFASGHYANGKGQVGLTALAIAEGKLGTPLHLFFAAILCNTLVCLAVWMGFSARSTVDRVVVIVPPVAAFVAAGFEHSVANMYFFPFALLIRDFAPPDFWVSVGRSPAELASLTWSSFLIGNLLPVTLGNVVGGAGLVGLVYWFVYLRARPVT
jgi:formate/nitrite transporter